MEITKLLDEQSLRAYNSVVFPVRKESVTDLFSTKLTPVSGISHAIIARDSQILNFCSEDYHLRTNSEIIHQLGNIFNEMGHKFSLRASRFKSSRFRIDFIMKDSFIDVGTRKVGDPISVSIRVFNSYDGTQGFSMEITLLRLVCENGMVTPEPVLSVRKIHTNQLLDFVDISEEKIRNGLLEAVGQLEDTAQYYYDLMDLTIKPQHLDSYVDEVIDEVGFPPSLKPGVIERIELEEAMGFEMNSWLVYNGFNYAINHLSSSLIGRKGRKLDNAILNYLLD